MKHLLRHMAKIGRVVAFLLVLANSGFTVALGYCTMEEMTCCGTTEEYVHVACGQGLPQQSASYVRQDGTCYTENVVGGVPSMPVLLQNEKTAQHIKLKLASIDTPSHLLLSSPITERMSSSSRFGSTNPLSAEIYILNSSFLI